MRLESNPGQRMDVECCSWLRKPWPSRWILIFLSRVVRSSLTGLNIMAPFLIPLNLGLSPTLLPTTRLLNLGIFLKSSSEFSFLFIQGTVATEMDFKWKTKMVKYFKLFSLASFYTAFFVWTKHLVWWWNFISISGFIKRVVEYAETKRFMTSEKQEGFYQNKFDSSLTFIQRPGN